VTLVACGGKTTGAVQALDGGVEVSVGDSGVSDATAANLDAPTPPSDAVADVLQCPPLWEACGGKCVAVHDDPNNCGQCGAKCGAGLFCSNGYCAIDCGDGGLTLCTAGCYDLPTDSDNCGTCGNKCSAGQVCNGGQCSFVCVGGAIMCGQSCVNTATDPQNCGACGIVCPCKQGPPTCTSGSCICACASSLTLCTTDGGSFCTNVQSDVNNCGSCGHACPIGEVCMAGQCQTVCATGFVDCGGTCIDPKTSNLFCGASGNCQGVNAGVPCAPGRQCSNGVCT
jgi:hypothetical protein